MQDRDGGRSGDKGLATVREQWFAFVYPAAFSMLALLNAEGYLASGEREQAAYSVRSAIGEVANLWLAASSLPGIAPEAAGDWSEACAALIDGCVAWTSVMESSLYEILRGAPARQLPTDAEQELIDRAGISMNEAHQVARRLYAARGGNPDDLPDAASLMAIMRAEGMTSPPHLPDLRHPGMRN